MKKSISGEILTPGSITGGGGMYKTQRRLPRLFLSQNNKINKKQDHHNKKQDINKNLIQKPKKLGLSYNP